MDIDVARYVIRACFRSGRELDDVRGFLKDHCSTSEYETYGKAIATAIATIQLEIANRIISAHPALEGEIESMIARYGRYL
jgi:hypothetical protein